VLFTEMDILLLRPVLEYRDFFEPLRMVWHHYHHHHHHHHHHQTVFIVRGLQDCPMAHYNCLYGVQMHVKNREK